MAKYKRINLLRTGLDIDDVLADFWSAYCERFDTANNPKMLESERITRNVQRILKHDKEFWLSLKPIVNLILYLNYIVQKEFAIKGGPDNG